ncbi:hypothetical protein HUJ05_010110 [Dendroctonus ponderosae]|nr:hypothetical protein HUJ05_010110 [Dendroctonus ponderosae]
MKNAYDIWRIFRMCLTKRKAWSPNSVAKNQKLRVTSNHRMVKLKPKKSFISKPDFSKPAWLKEWTISKGWVHNRSHMLSLGMNKMDNATYNKIETDGEKAEEEDASDSSSISNVEDLISIISNMEGQQAIVLGSNQTDDNNRDNSTQLRASIGQQKSTNNLLYHDTAEERNENITEIFEQISENYREKFKIESKSVLNSRYHDLQLPNVYKEKLLQKAEEEHSILKDMWKGLKHIKILGSKSSSYNGKFTVNQLYGVTASTSKEVSSTKHPSYLNPLVAPIEPKTSPLKQTAAKRSCSKNSLGKNIALHNTLNAKSNIHEEAILECSDESNFNSLSYIYYNPAYVPAEQNFVDFHSNHTKDVEIHRQSTHINRPSSRSPNFSSRNSKRNKYQLLPHRNDEVLKYKAKTEKYIIRHVRIRIMLSLRIGKKIKDDKGMMAKIDSVKQSARKTSGEIEDMRRNINRMHEEQRRIGNGKTSIKIQNMSIVLQNFIFEKNFYSAVKNDFYRAFRKPDCLAFSEEFRSRAYTELKFVLSSMVTNETPLKMEAIRDGETYGRLNVLRWLLWEAESREGSTIGSCGGMPALEKGAATAVGEPHGPPNGNATLALHYAAARGCLDCVRLLVDSSVELRNNYD